MDIKRLKGSNKKTGKCVLGMSGEFNIYFAQAIKADLSEHIASYHHLTLDLSDVEEFDSTGVQILLALKQYLTDENSSFQIRNASEPVVRLLKTYHLESAFTA